MPVDPAGFFLAGLAAQQEASRGLAIEEARNKIQADDIALRQQEREERNQQAMIKRYQDDVQRIIDTAVKIKQFGGTAASLGMSDDSQAMVADLKSSVIEMERELQRAGIQVPSAVAQFDAAVNSTLTASQTARAEALAGVEGARAVAEATGAGEREAFESAGLLPAAEKSLEEKVAETTALEEARQSVAARFRQPTSTGFSSTIGKLLEDQAKAIKMFGEDSPQALAFDEAIQQEQVGEEASLSDVRGMRQEFTKLSGPFIEFRDAYQTILASAEDPDGAGDLSLIIAYMKLLDPGSVVREGEFETVRQTGAISDRLWGLYLNVKDGDRLTPELRDQFLGRADKLFDRRLASQRDLEQSFTNLADVSDIPVEQVVIDFVGSRPSRTSTATTGVDFDGKLISEMGETEISAVDIGILTPEQRQAMLDRLKELEQQNAK